MAKKDKDMGSTATKKVIVKKVKENPYAPLLKLTYRSLVAFGFIVIAWMGYEIYLTASNGLKQHEKQKAEYRKAMGIEEPKEKAETKEDDKDKKEQDGEGEGN